MIYSPAEDGQGLVEYALILMLVALVIVAILTLFGTTLSTLFSRVTSELGVALGS